MNYTHTCLQCGNEYVAQSNRQGYCPDCRKERQKERNRKYQERKNSGQSRSIGSADTCANCGQSYIIKTGSQILCDNCIKKGVNMQKSKNNTAYRNRNYDSVHFYLPKGAREQLKAFAEEHGMSLNQFMNFAIDLAADKLVEMDEAEENTD